MPFIIVILAVFLFIAGIGMIDSFSQSREQKPVTSQEIMNSSRSQIEDMLKQIETKNAPERKMGAMCYEEVAPPDYQEYICPLDGEKTVYDRKNSETYWTIENIVEMRRLVEQINSVTDLADLKLDGRRLCSKCFPGLKSSERYVSLVTTYPDGREHVYDKISVEDLRILAGFFDKKLFYKTSNDGEEPLKDKAAKIQEMLGAEKQ